MVRCSSIVLLAVCVAAAHAAAVPGGSEKHLAARADVGAGQHAKGKMDAKFFGSPGMRGPGFFGGGTFSITGAFSFAQQTLMPFFNNAINNFNGGGIAFSTVQSTITQMVQQFSLLSQYMQGIQCVSCGIAQAQSAQFQQVIVQMFLQMQSLLNVVTQNFAGSLGQLMPLFSPLQSMFSSFFSQTSSFGIASALAANPAFNLQTWSSIGINFQSISGFGGLPIGGGLPLGGAGFGGAGVPFGAGGGFGAGGAFGGGGVPLGAGGAFGQAGSFGGIPAAVGGGAFGGSPAQSLGLGGAGGLGAPGLGGGLF